jgi:hypothetical protein
VSFVMKKHREPVVHLLRTRRGMGSQSGKHCFCDLGPSFVSHPDGGPLFNFPSTNHTEVEGGPITL